MLSLDSGANTAMTVAVAMAGGLPLLQDGICIGAIGISGMTPELDSAIAAAGVAALY